MNTTAKMTCSLKILVFAAMLSLHFELCFCECSKSSHEEDGDCCPTCDTVQGLKVKISCTQSSNTVCEPLNGHYCTDHFEGNCVHASEYTKCLPGQYIKQRGTQFTDHECADCPKATYSDGSFSTCKPYTNCTALGRKEIKPGTPSSDAECNTPVALIVGIVVGSVLFVAILVAIVVVSIIMCLRVKQKSVQNAAAVPENDQTQWKTESSFSWHVIKVFIQKYINKPDCDDTLKSVEN
ncbi:tumor necrosis factor receptor superfamily member 14-like [Hoplias malabaricus]|uniref:tumor necrosis factor receptor superfamily member 14-like n=1 Tax=Hoplias malabaricus TaxID=27720 RepID=UPI003462C4EA